jgi:SAM-dependent methyltransferase
MGTIWDERYNTRQFIFGTEPNVFFASELTQLIPGKLLLPGEGEGRNAVFAALNNWQVTAYDTSTIGRSKALKLAAENGVAIDYQIMDYTQMPYATESFDAIALVFAHMPSAIRTKVHQHLVTLLKPGGTLILESYSKQQHQYKTGGPSDADMLYSLPDLRDDFCQLSHLEAYEIVVPLNEGTAHVGNSALVRVTGIK